MTPAITIFGLLYLGAKAMAGRQGPAGAASIAAKTREVLPIPRQIKAGVAAASSGGSSGTGVIAAPSIHTGPGGGIHLLAGP